MIISRMSGLSDLIKNEEENCLRLTLKKYFVSGTQSDKEKCFLGKYIANKKDRHLSLLRNDQLK